MSSEFISLVFTPVFILLWLLQAAVVSGLIRRWHLLNINRELSFMAALIWPGVLAFICGQNIIKWIERKVAGDVPDRRRNY